MIRSSQATDMYKNLAQTNASQIAEYAQNLLAGSQKDTASLLANLMLWYMNGYDVLNDTQKQSLSTSQGNATKTQAILEIYSSYEFPFRERTHIILTLPRIDAYQLPQGLIMRDKDGCHLVKYNSQILNLIENPNHLEHQSGIPTGFYICRNKNFISRKTK